MSNLVKRGLAVAALTVAMAAQAVAGQDQLPKDRAGGDMLLDAVIVRPISLVAIVAGSVAFVVALPFTIISGSVDSAANELVKKPIAFTFRRPLGQIEDQD